MPAQFPIRTRSRVKDSRPFAFGVYSLPSVGGFTDNYPPALDLNFLTGFIDSRITYTGGTNGTRIDPTGTIAAATAPRFDYDPVSRAPLGLLIEEARTNLLLNSLIDGTSLSTQSITTTNVAHVLSFYGTGTVTLTGTSTAGPAVGGGAYPTRTTLLFTPTAGSLTLTVSGSVKFAQLEAGAQVTSFIPTAGATVTRTVDTATMTGANFTSWYNSLAGTIVITSDATAGKIQRPVSINDNTSNNAIALVYQAGDTAASVITTGGVSQVNDSLGSISPGTVWTAAIAWQVNDVAGNLNGGAVVADMAATIPTVTQMQIGRQAAIVPTIGHIRRLRYWSDRLSDSKLPTLTTP